MCRVRFLFFRGEPCPRKGPTTNQAFIGLADKYSELNRTFWTIGYWPSVWFRYVDDTFVKIDRNAVDDFTSHINGLDLHIKFTSESEADNKLAFLDTLAARKSDGIIKITVYRKATHTDQLVDFNSHHPWSIRSVWFARSLIERKPLSRKKLTLTLV